MISQNISRRVLSNALIKISPIGSCTISCVVVIGDIPNVYLSLCVLLYPNNLSLCVVSLVWHHDNLTWAL